MSVTNLNEKRFIKCITDNGFLFDAIQNGYTRIWETNSQDGKLQR